MKIIMCEYLRTNTIFQVGSHKYAKRFCRDRHELLWLNNYWSILNVIKNPRDTFNDWTIWRKGRKLSSNCEYSPFTFLPFAHYPLLNNEFSYRNTLKFTFPNLKTHLEKNTWSAVDVLWMSNAKMGSLMDMMDYKLMVHRMSDNYAAFDNVSPQMVKAEEAILSKADMILCTARNLMEKARTYNKHVFYLPNGVDFEHFQRAGNQEPEIYKEIKGKKVIYEGAIDSWLDTDLIIHCARKLKDVSFIIIGPKNGYTAMLKGEMNIYILGKVDFNELPRYLKFCDAGIIPFKNNELTNSIHPLKLYEYFAAGLPVVTRNLEEIKAMSSPALLAESYDEFCSCIEEALKAGKNTQSYLEYALRNSWDNRYNAMMGEISKMLEQQ